MHLQSSNMTQVVIRGESVYQCDKCTRKVRVLTNKYGIDTLSRCNITLNCRGSLRQIKQLSLINNTPQFAPEVNGVQDWFQRRIFYQFTQSLQSNVWTINHNLANNPIITAYVYGVVDNQTVLIQDSNFTTQLIDSNTTQITFTRPVSGIAHAVTLSSQKGNIATPIVLDPQFQITNDSGDITVAVRVSGDAPDSWSADSININIKYATPNGTTIEYLKVQRSPSIVSPWIGVKRIVANGKIYMVHSFNLTTQPPADSVFQAGTILNGTQFNITQLNGVNISNGDILILLADSPYTPVDRSILTFIDAGRADVIMTYDSGTASVPVTAITNTYPPITVV